MTSSDVIQYVFTSLLGPKHKVTVEAQKSLESSSQAFMVTVPKEDMARIIGKNGSVIRAIRLLVNLHSKPQGNKTYINLTESGAASP